MDSKTEQQLLTAYFKKRLSELRPIWKGPLSYEGDTPFDLLYYRLQEEAARDFQRRYGYLPPLGRIHRAFFAAQWAHIHRPYGSLSRRLLRLWWSLRLALF